MAGRRGLVLSSVRLGLRAVSTRHDHPSDSRSPNSIGTVLSHWTRPGNDEDNAPMSEQSPQLLDLSLTTPEENLALDEALLVQSEAALAAGAKSARHEWLRLWESPGHFVVLGVSGRRHQEVFVDRCRQLGIPILRRASGGGTVLQGPGCLNFSLILSLRDRPRLRDLHASYRSILEQTAMHLAPEAEFRGISDLALARESGSQSARSGNAEKFSGNAQKRTRHALLHHGTILYHFDIALVEQVLKTPPQQPEYRRQRSHTKFCTNLPLEARQLKEAITLAWKAKPRHLATLPDLTTLIEEKYGNPTWTERF